MKRIEGQTFVSWFDRDSGRVFADVQFVRCDFINCHVSITNDPKLRSTVRNVSLIDCSADIVAGLSPVVLEDVYVENLHAPQLKCFGAVYKRVGLVGTFPLMIFENRSLLYPAAPDMDARFAEANAVYYQSVDWALDISRARFSDCAIRGIPSRLIRRDPETQVVVTREQALSGAWKSLDLGRANWMKRVFEDLCTQNDEDALIIVRNGRKGLDKDELAAVELLRKHGLALPD